MFYDVLTLRRSPLGMRPSFPRTRVLKTLRFNPAASCYNGWQVGGPPSAEGHIEALRQSASGMGAKQLVRLDSSSDGGLLTEREAERRFCVLGVGA